MMVKLQRYEGNPILSPNQGNWWEALAVFNPAAWYDPQRGEVVMLYRAAEAGPQYRCYFGMAVSKNGYDFERVSDEPVFSPSVDGFDASTVQDPRMVKMGDWYYITYAARHFPFGQFWKPADERYRHPVCPDEFPRVIRTNATTTGLLLTKDFKIWIRAGRITNPVLDDRDVILFPEKIGGKFVMMHRPLEWVGPRYGTEHPAVWISMADDLLGFKESKLLIRAQLPWENNKIGINTPPIHTEHGWLTLYHAVGTDKFYRIGALLLDLDDPSIVRHRSRHWLMQPETDYEIEGYYRGVCFPCGKVVIDGTLFVYYGGGDKYVAVATCKLDELLEYLLTCPA